MSIQWVFEMRLARLAHGWDIKCSHAIFIALIPVSPQQH